MTESGKRARPAPGEDLGLRQLLECHLGSSWTEHIHRAYRRLQTKPAPSDAPVVEVIESLVGRSVDPVTLAAVLLVHLRRTGRISRQDLAEFGEATARLVELASPVLRSGGARWLGGSERTPPFVRRRQARLRRLLRDSAS